MDEVIRELQHRFNEKPSVTMIVKRQPTPPQEQTYLEWFYSFFF